jgi:hypothetical protein
VVATGAALQHIYGHSLKPAVDADPALLRQYDQRPFWSRADNFGNETYNETTPHITGFAPAGYVSAQHPSFCWVLAAARAAHSCGFLSESFGCCGAWFWANTDLRAKSMRSRGGQMQDAL